MKPLKLTRQSDGMSQYINPLAVAYFHWDDDRNYTEVWILGEAPSNGPIGVTETPDQIAAMLAESPELEREAWRQMEECRRAIQSAMASIEEAAMAVRNAQ